MLEKKNHKWQKEKKKSKEKTVQSEECPAMRTRTRRSHVPPSHVGGVMRTREGNASRTAAGVEIPRPCREARWLSVSLSATKPASGDLPIDDNHVDAQIRSRRDARCSRVQNDGKGEKPGTVIQKAATAGRARRPWGAVASQRRSEPPQIHGRCPQPALCPV